MSYKPHSIYLSEPQQKKLAKSLKERSPFTVRLSSKQLQEDGNVKLPMTKQQIKKLKKARAQKTGSQLSISKTQSAKIMSELKKNPEMLGGGFLSVLGKIIPSLIGPAIEGITSLLSPKKGSGVFLAGEGSGGIMNQIEGMDLAAFLDACGVELTVDGLIKKKR